MTTPSSTWQAATLAKYQELRLTAAAARGMLNAVQREVGELASQRRDAVQRLAALQREQANSSHRAYYDKAIAEAQSHLAELETAFNSALALQPKIGAESHTAGTLENSARQILTKIGLISPTRGAL